jgi:hypothetical protein
LVGVRADAAAAKLGRLAVLHRAAAARLRRLNVILKNLRFRGGQFWFAAAVLSAARPVGRN